MTNLTVSQDSNIVIINDQTYILQNIKNFYITKEKDGIVSISNFYTDKIIASDHFQNWKITNVDDNSIETPVDTQDDLVQAIIDLFNS